MSAKTTRKQKLHDTSLYHIAQRLIKYDGYSIRKAACETDIPYQTLRDHITGKYAHHVTSFGPPRLLTTENEESLSNYASYMASRGVPLSRPVMKQLARDIAKQQGGGDVMPSDKWLRSYIHRHPELTLRTAHPLQQDRVSVNQETIDHYFSLLENTVNSLNLQDDSTRIYNCDESGFSGKLNPSKKVIVPKGTRHAYQSIVSLSGHITMLNAISASGQTLPPMLIYSQCLPRNYSDGVPDSWVFKCTEKGYITSDLFVEWFLKCFIPFIGEKRPVLLILDNHITHLSKGFIDAAKKHKIELLYLPAHSSHMLQPQDAGYFHVLKQKIAELAIQLGYLGVKTLPRGLFPKILLQALNRITGVTVSAAFKCTGIVPLNKKAVSALLPTINHSSAKASTSKQPTEQSLAPCEHCGSSRENPLVKMGLVDPILANILVQPPAPNHTKVTKRKTYTKARAVLSTEPLCKQKKTVTMSDSFITEQEDMALCVVCMMGSMEELFWVGCDTCDKWYHYECLPRHVQLDVDLSIITEGLWSCRYCQEE
jgi:hypothetical protein